MNHHWLFLLLVSLVEARVTAYAAEQPPLKAHNHTAFAQYGIGYATADKPLGPWVKAGENPIAATNLDIGVSGPGHNSITRSPDGKEIFIIYHTHADPQKPSGNRVMNIDRLHFTESGQLRIKGPTRSPQPMPSGCR
jgi:hypothetical protein